MSRLLLFAATTIGLLSLVPAFAIGGDGGWFVYQFISSNGNRWPNASLCEPMKPPADSIARLNQQGADFRVVDLLVKKNKPVVVDIQMPRVTGNGDLIVNTARFVKGKTLCDKIRKDDISGELDRARLNRYR